jgi:putative nucleotidyltransferase with HDIG domain
MIGADVQQAFSLALLHDIGEAVIASIDSEYLSLLEERRTTPLTSESEATMMTVERKRYGMHHGTLGADMLATWNFHPDLVQAVAHHHTPKGSLSRAHAALVDGDRIAYLISSELAQEQFSDTAGLLLPNYVSDDKLEWLLAIVRTRATSMIADLF